jgi:arylsulfatase A-like enzyme
MLRQRRYLPIAILIALVSAVSLMVLSAGRVSGGDPPGPQQRRPNFLIIISDDQRYDTLGRFMPLAQARIFGEGVTFKNGYVTTPLCCPSRSSILTGMYASRHGVHHNSDPLRQPTFVERLHNAGYTTGLIGKYLNSWDGSALPQFDLLAAFSHSEQTYDNPRLSINGSWKSHEGYITAILRDYALGFLDEVARQDTPFALIFAPPAPHFPAQPAPGDKDLYPDLPPYRPPNYNEADLSGKPQWLQKMPPLDVKRQGEIDHFRRKQLQTLWSLDQAVGAVLDRLQRQHRLDDTVIFYLSDNGLFWGEHRLPRGKDHAYEPSIRVPFAMRYPRLIDRGRVEPRLVANIDIAPTIYDLAGIPIPPDVDGRSLVPLLQGSSDWREEVLIEGWSRPAYAAVHTARFVYIDTKGRFAELYDLERDPYQLENRANDPAYAPVVTDMRARLLRLRPQGWPSPAAEPEKGIDD